MPLTLPDLDDRSYADLVAEARSLIPALAPDWTDHNPADPGITLIELFAWLTEMLLYRINQVTDANRLAFLHLLNGPKWKHDPKKSVDEEVRETVLALRRPARAVSAADFEYLTLRVKELRERIVYLGATCGRRWGHMKRTQQTSRRMSASSLCRSPVPTRTAFVSKCGRSWSRRGC